MRTAGTAVRSTVTPSSSGSSARRRAAIPLPWRAGGFGCYAGRSRAHDSRHLIGVGLLQLGGPFGPANVADLLDVLLVHEYPETGREGDAIATVCDFAAHGRPVVLGETAPLLTTHDRWRSFLTGTRRFVDGSLFFYDGRR